MKTGLITTANLNDPINDEKTRKWLKYYTQLKKELGVTGIHVLNNGPTTRYDFDVLNRAGRTRLKFHAFPQHLPRTGHLDYPYLWRAVDHFKECFKIYDKIIYMDNDFYILSERFAKHIKDFRDGWMSPWCARHNFPETGLQVLTKTSQCYPISYPYSRFNGQCMELTLPVSTEKGWIGDRHSEYGVTFQDRTWDFSAQVPLEMEMECVK